MIIFADVKFFLPDDQTFTHIHYAICIAFGKVTAPSFAKSMSEEDLKHISTSHDNLHIYIPFLSSEEGGSPELRLELLSFTSSHGHFVSPNVIFDLQPADVLQYDINDGNANLSFRFGDLALNITGDIRASCHWQNQHDVAELEETISELGITQNIPDFSICEELTNPEGNQFCDVAEEFADIIDESGSNVCIRWTLANSNVGKCDASFHILHISEELKKFLGLADDHPNSLVAENINVLANINLKVPCVE